LKSQAQARQETEAINSTFAALVKQIAKLKCKVERHLRRGKRVRVESSDE